MSKYTMRELVIQYVTLDVRNPTFISDPLSVPDDHVQSVLVVDRTVPGGLNFQAEDVTVSFTMESSLDGLSWQLLSGGTGSGGLISAGFNPGKPWGTVMSAGDGLPEGGNRLVRAVITVTSHVSAAYPLGIAGALATDVEPLPFATS